MTSSAIRAILIRAGDGRRCPRGSMVRAASDLVTERAAVPMSRFGSTPRVRCEGPEFVDPGPSFFCTGSRSLAGQLHRHPLQQLRDPRLALVSVVGQQRLQLLAARTENLIRAREARGRQLLLASEQSALD